MNKSILEKQLSQNFLNRGSASLLANIAAKNRLFTHTAAKNHFFKAFCFSLPFSPNGNFREGILKDIALP